MASNISMLGQSTADMATTGIANARSTYQSILATLGRAMGIGSFNQLVSTLNATKTRLDEAEAHYTGAPQIMSDPTVAKLRESISKVLVALEGKLGRMKRTEEKVSVLRMQRQAALEEKEAEEKGAVNGERKIPWVPIAIGGGALLLALSMGG